jgi:hypothetical protein
MLTPKFVPTSTLALQIGSSAGLGVVGLSLSVVFLLIPSWLCDLIFAVMVGAAMTLANSASDWWRAGDGSK